MRPRLVAPQQPVQDLLVYPCTFIMSLVFLQTAGLGGMKPNTLALGFYSRDLPRSSLNNLQLKVNKKPEIIRYIIRDQSREKFTQLNAELPPLRTLVSFSFTPRA